MSKWSARGRRWAATAELVKDRDGHQCMQCGSDEDLTVDHVVPMVDLIAQDRQHLAYDLDNLVTLCRSCNGSKGDRPEGRGTIVNPAFADVLGLPAAGWRT